MMQNVAHSKTHTSTAQRNALDLLLAHYRLAFLFVACAALYLLAAFVVPLGDVTHDLVHIAPRQAVLQILAAYVPYLCLWFIALIGYLRLRDYARSIEHTKDGQAFAEITLGLFWLTLWLPLSAVLVAGSAFFSRLHPEIARLAVYLSTYSTLVIMLISLWFIYRGSKRLLLIVRKSLQLPLILRFAFLAFGPIYTYLTLKDPSRQVPAHGADIATYYLSDWAILLTIIIPRLVTWYLGIQAAYNLYKYRTSVSGIIYREAFVNLSIGISGIVIVTATYRSFQAAISQLEDLNITLVILLAYAFVALAGLGYLLVGRGASKLHKFEEL